jgi:uncharacterized membrane protein YoaT (DUF817 family)
LSHNKILVAERLGVARITPALFFEFARQQALSCVFPFSFVAALALTRRIGIPGVPRYDLLLVIGLAIQALMLLTRMETRDELKVICVFHALGLALELFKVRAGSWAYPEFSWTKIGGVPLYSGFMYASVASYMCQAWRRLDLRMDHWPPSIVTGGLAAALYLNFFTHHFLPDLRWALAAAVLLAFLRTRVTYRVSEVSLQMPMTLAFLLIGLFVWFAENIATRLGAWQYPHQVSGWQMVHAQKIGSWTLLAIVSLVVVAQLKRVKYGVGTERE